MAANNLEDYGPDRRNKIQTGLREIRKLITRN